MKKISKLMTLAAIVAMSFSLIACGDDDNEESGGSSTAVFESVTAAYEASLSEDFLKFYDATVIFTDTDGNLMQAPLTKDEKFDYTIPVAKLPEKICFAVQLKAKSSTPEIDANAQYNFAHSVKMTITGNKSDGSKERIKSDGNSNSLTFAGNKVADYLAKYPERVFGPYEYATDQFKNQ